MSANQESKKVVVSEIRGKLDKALSVVLVDYRGLTVLEVTQLRNEFRAANVEYRVLKNTLVGRAAEDLGIEGLAPYLEGTNAFAFSYDDPAAASKILRDFARKTRKTQVRAAIVGKKVTDDKGALALADLPSREAVVGMLVGVLAAPIRGLVTVLSGTTRSLVVALDQIREKKEKGDVA